MGGERRWSRCREWEAGAARLRERCELGGWRSLTAADARRQMMRTGVGRSVLALLLLVQGKPANPALSTGCVVLFTCR